MYLIDSHCHLDCLNLKNYKNKFSKIIKNAYSKKVKLILSVSTSLKNFKKIKELFKNTKYNIFYSCGIHPLNIKKKKMFLKNYINFVKKKK